MVRETWHGPGATSRVNLCEGYPSQGSWQANTRGICKPGLLQTQHGTNPALMHSFDCSKLITVQAQLICGDAELAYVDKTLTKIYDQKIKVSANKNRLRAD